MTVKEVIITVISFIIMVLWVVLWTVIFFGLGCVPLTIYWLYHKEPILHNLWRLLRLSYTLTFGICPRHHKNERIET